MQKLNLVEAETLLYEPLEKPSFVVDGLIPTGLSLFCGSQKIGKSWLMLKLCLCVSQGLPLWDMPTKAGDVLYLCLEDTFFRIQDRLFRLTDEANRKLHFAVASCKLSDGLMVQLEDYLKVYPDSRLTAAVGAIEQAGERGSFSPAVRVTLHVGADSLHILKGFRVDNGGVGVLEDYPFIFVNVVAFLVLEMLAGLEVDGVA